MEQENWIDFLHRHRKACTSKNRNSRSTYRCAHGRWKLYSKTGDSKFLTVSRAEHQKLYDKYYPTNQKGV